MYKPVICDYQRLRAQPLEVKPERPERVSMIYEDRTQHSIRVSLRPPEMHLEQSDWAQNKIFERPIVGNN